MRTALVSAALLALAACTGQQQTGIYRGDVVGTACVDVSGGTEPAHCTLPGPDLGGTDIGFCQCPATARRVEAPLCAKGEREPTQTREYREAVKAATAGDSTLVGDTFNGKPMCILPRQT